MRPTALRHYRAAPWLVFLAVTVAPGIALGAQLTLTWRDNATNEAGYRIERKTGSGGSYSEIAILAANSTSYTDPNLAASTTYCYRVRAFNTAGVSGYSNEACSTTPQNALNLTVTRAGTGSGTVVSAPGGINCGSDCGEAFSSGAVVTLTATASAGSRFDGWSGGGCAGTGPCTVTGNTSVTVTARFTGSSSTTMTVSPTTIAAGGTVTATWSGISTPRPTDWIGLYAQGTADTAFLAWIYVSCSQTPGTARAAGSCAFPIPSTLAAGSYELRLLANDDFTRLATSGALAVSASLTVSPTTIGRGGTVTATWSGFPSPTPTDWIGLYAPGTPDSAFLAWIYVSCSQTPGTARTSGSCVLRMPSTVAAGSYELRLLAHDDFVRVVTSNRFTITP